MEKKNLCKRISALLLTGIVLFALMLPCMATGGMGNSAGNAANNGGALGRAAEDIGGAVEDLLPGDQNLPGDESGNRTQNNSGETGSQNNNPLMDNNRESTGLTDDGKTEGNAQDGVVGESDTANTAETDANAVTSTDNGGTNWIGIVIAILVIAALAAVILAIFPKKKA